MGTARRKNEPELTVGDRLVTALMGFVGAFLTMCVVWLIAMRAMPHEKDPPIPFAATWIVGLVVGVVGFAAGPERMMDGFGAVWASIGRMFFRRLD
ncbi:MAG: hypothetical protein ACYC61_00535 [Isosphaeraceae bacterium]